MSSCGSAAAHVDPNKERNKQTLVGGGASTVFLPNQVRQ